MVCPKMVGKHNFWYPRHPSHAGAGKLHKKPFLPTTLNNDSPLGCDSQQ